MKIDWQHGLKRPKIDVHCHVWPMDDWEMSVDQLIRSGEMLGITEFWTSAPLVGGRWGTPDEIRRYNNVTLDAMKRRPDRVRGLCFIMPGHWDDAMSEAQRCLDAGMIGIKLYNQYKIHDPVVLPILRLAAERQVPVLVHAAYLTDADERSRQPLTSHGEDFARASEAVPDATLIHAHIGGGGDWERTIRDLRGASPNVYVDVSGSNLDDGQVEFAARELGVERVLFGTDGTMAGAVGKVLDSALSDAEMERVFRGNARRILAMQGLRPLDEMGGAGVPNL